MSDPTPPTPPFVRIPPFRRPSVADAGPGGRSVPAVEDALAASSAPAVASPPAAANGPHAGATAVTAGGIPTQGPGHVTAGSPAAAEPAPLSDSAQTRPSDTGNIMQQAPIPVPAPGDPAPEPMAPRKPSFLKRMVSWTDPSKPPLRQSGQSPGTDVTVATGAAESPVYTLVTGATGFVGSAVARALATEGHTLRLLVRPGADRGNIDGLEAEIAEGDLTDAVSLAAALVGCRYLVHVAADYRLWVPNPAAMQATNVDGTRALLLAARDAGVERIVYCSSVAALGLVGDGTPGTENTPVERAEIIGAYKQSKYDAEMLVRAMAADGVPVVIVAPSAPVGPRDRRPTPTGKMILDAAAGRMPAYVDTGLNIVHVDDVARGHVLALQHGQVGETYILGGEDLGMAHLLAIIDDAMGRPPRNRRKLSTSMLAPIAIGSELKARVFRTEPRVTREMLAMANKQMFFSSAKAADALGYSARPARQAVADAIAWFRQAGMLRD